MCNYTEEIKNKTKEISILQPITQASLTKKANKLFVLLHIEWCENNSDNKK